MVSTYEGDFQEIIGSDWKFSGSVAIPENLLGDLVQLQIINFLK